MDNDEIKRPEEIIADLIDRVAELESRVGHLSSFMFQDRVIIYKPKEDFVSDPLFEDAVNTVLDACKASPTLLQRRLSIGYARAAKLINMMDAQGIIGPEDGSKPRDVLLTKEDYEKIKRFNNKNKKEE